MCNELLSLLSRTCKFEVALQELLFSAARNGLFNLRECGLFLLLPRFNCDEPGKEQWTLGGQKWTSINKIVVRSRENTWSWTLFETFQTSAWYAWKIRCQILRDAQQKEIFLHLACQISEIMSASWADFVCEKQRSIHPGYTGAIASLCEKCLGYRIQMMFRAVLHAEEHHSPKAYLIAFLGSTGNVALGIATRVKETKACGQNRLLCMIFASHNCIFMFLSWSLSACCKSAWLLVCCFVVTKIKRLFLCPYTCTKKKTLSIVKKKKQRSLLNITWRPKWNGMQFTSTREIWPFNQAIWTSNCSMYVISFHSDSLS